MADELNVISSELLVDVRETEVKQLINEIVEASKENMDEICELTLECTTLLTAAQGRQTALKGQGILKRLWGAATGKNQRIRDSVLENNTNALFVAQEMINRVMKECMNNRKLLLAVNDRLSDVYVELKENLNEQAAGILMIRKAVVSFYAQYKEALLAQEKRILRVEEFAKERCPGCGKEISTWQRVCSHCGLLHPLKTERLSRETIEKLEELSGLVAENALSEEILWNEVARKKERVLRKVKLMAELGRLPGYTTELEQDIDNLIAKCKSDEFRIAIVGVMKAGKSFLMNALMGAEIASVEVNPETAALTKFRSANGYYVKICFHKEREWKRLKDSAFQSRNSGKESLRAMLERPETEQLEKIWVNHEKIRIECKDIEELRQQVKKYTSSGSLEHLFVSEVEVGVDKTLFHMPKEVVFVDTPGLKDPVKYRSDITKAYIKKANAVLVAVPTNALTAEGNEVITTVLDCTDAAKAYIIATQKDTKDNEEDCEKIVSYWARQLVSAKRYENEKRARSRILLTSAKMELLLSKWLGLTEEQREDESFFSDQDYSDLEHYVKKVLGNRRYKIEDLPYNDAGVEQIRQNAGIELLRRKLESTMISRHRELKLEGIEIEYSRCRDMMKRISEQAVDKQLRSIEIAECGVEEIRRQIAFAKEEKSVAERENNEIKAAAERLTKAMAQTIATLERKGE